MFLFKRKFGEDIDTIPPKAQAESKCWKDEQGVIRCPGEACKTECSDACPIWLNTKGVNYLMGNQPDEALPLFEKAVEIEADFEGVYNNLAASYGMTGKYENAIKAYQHKLEFTPDDEDAIFGIALSYKNLKEYEKALEYCEKYEQLFGSDEKIQRIKRACNQSADEKQYNSVNLCMNMIQVDAEEGFIDYRGGVPHIPELIAEMSRVCNGICEGLLEEDIPEERFFALCGEWCAMASMGAVYLWNEDWDKLRRKGIIYSLIEKRGFYAMDEYVLSIMGIEFESEEGEMLCSRLRNWGLSFEEMFSNEGQLEEAAQSAFYEAMYLYGMIYAMARLGMH